MFRNDIRRAARLVGHITALALLSTACSRSATPWRAISDSTASAPRPETKALGKARTRLFRTYVSLENVTFGTVTAKNGEKAEVSLILTPPAGAPRNLPDNGKTWTVAQGASIPVAHTFEVEAARLEHDGFEFVIQMHRRGESYAPCVFHVEKMSEFNRTYVCKSVESPTSLQAPSAPELAVQVAVFTDLNSTPGQLVRRLAKR